MKFKTIIQTDIKGLTESNQMFPVPTPPVVSTIIPVAQNVEQRFSDLTLFFNAFNQIIQTLSTITQTLARIEIKLGTITADVAALLATTSSIVTDTATILTDLSNANNITAAQQTQLETAIASLQSVDTNLQAVINPVVPPAGP